MLCVLAQAVSFKWVSLSLVQSLDPLPMHGRDLGVNPDDLVETPELEQEAKQEILENKDVSSSSVTAVFTVQVLSNCGSKGNNSLVFA